MDSCPLQIGANVRLDVQSLALGLNCSHPPFFPGLLNFSLRKIIKGRSAFPNDDSVYRLIYFGLEQISRKWMMPIKNWKAALQQFAILYEDRLPLEALSHH
jgi:hypothetical protein